MLLAVARDRHALDQFHHEVCRRLSHDRKIGPVESGRLYHLMAKAAVAVYEAVAQNESGAKGYWRRTLATHPGVGGWGSSHGRPAGR